MNNYTRTLSGCNTTKISFKRETIARRGIFIEKKRYTMWALNDEGNVPIDKLKITGLEVVRSSTAPIARKELKKIIFDILRQSNRNHTVEQIKDIRKKFFKADIEDISFPMSCGNLVKYTNLYKQAGKFDKTPVHVKGSILHNIFLDKHPNLRKTYDYIYEGEKIKMLKMKPNNMWDSDIISYKKWMKESDLAKFIDMDRQFQIAFINPMERFFKVLQWPIPRFDHHEFASIFVKKPPTVNK
jgi:DNA polymerase elongation subunit (family B)